MPLHILELERPPASPAPAHPAIPVPGFFGFHSATISRGVLPGRGLVYSILLHVLLAWYLVVWSPALQAPVSAPSHQWDLTVIPNDRDVLYLPRLGGGSSSGKLGGALLATNEPLRSASASAPSKPGANFPGEQTIVSNPPNPNSLQTILQPDLLNPLPATRLFPLPNVVKLRSPAPAPLQQTQRPLEPPGGVVAPSEAPTRKVPLTMPEQPPSVLIPPSVPQLSALVSPGNPNLNPPEPAPAPVIIPNPTSPPEVPKLSVPVGKTAEIPPMLRPQAPHVPEADPPQPPPTQISGLRSLADLGGVDSQHLLVLSPLPAPQTEVLKVPPVEERGQFAVAGVSDPLKRDIGPGSADGASHAPSSTGIAVGSGSSPAAQDATSTNVVALGSNGTPESGKAGGQSGYGDQPGAGGPGVGRGGMGAGAGSTTGNGTGAGRGPGTTAGSGSGAGAGPGPGPFAGITIQGGEPLPGRVPGSGLSPSGLRPPAAPGQGLYGLTIIATGNSGGGLGDFGVFQNEAVFTVYINMARSADDPAPAWVLQYAAIGAAGAAPGNLSPPFPIKKKAPEWPEELASRYARQLIVVSATITVEGKVEGSRILQCPNRQLGTWLSDSLQEWSFRPAQISSHPVAVKILLGVPIGLYR